MCMRVQVYARMCMWHVQACLCVSMHVCMCMCTHKAPQNKVSLTLSKQGIIELILEPLFY